MRWIYKEFGISRNTVKKYLREPDAPKYTRTKPRSRPVADNWQERVKEIVDSDKTRRGSSGTLRSGYTTGW